MANGVLSTLRDKSPASTYVKTGNSNALSDYQVLMSGTSLAFIIVPFSVTRTRVGFGGERENEWQVDVQIFAKYLGDKDTHTALTNGMQAVLDTIDAWPKLVATSGVQIAEVISVSPPEPLYDIDGSGPHFIMRDVRISVIECISVSEQE